MTCLYEISFSVCPWGGIIHCHVIFIYTIYIHYTLLGLTIASYKGSIENSKRKVEKSEVSYVVGLKILQRKGKYY